MATSAHSPAGPGIFGKAHQINAFLCILYYKILRIRRTCCFNYLRKRTDPNVKQAPSTDVNNELPTYGITTKSIDLPINSHEKHLLAELKSFKDEQKAKTQAFVAQLHRFFFGQISAFLYVQLLESRRFYDMMLAADGRPLTTAAAVGSSPRESA